MRTCARCGLISPDQSIFCECGFDFRFDDKRSVEGEHSQWKSAARSTLVVGSLIFVLGGATSVLSYVQAHENGGRFFITHGLVIVGLGLVARSIARLRAIRDIERDE